MNLLRFLYRTAAGRLLLKPLTARPFSVAAGAFLDTSLSKLLIGPFVRSQKIDLSEYDLSEIHSFNDFFCRPLLPGKRPVDEDPGHLAAPCDGLLSAYRIGRDTVLPVKQSRYTISALLNDEDLAARYEGGLCLVFRLCVNHYHRYIYAGTGKKSGSRFIPGKLHTVRPVALAEVPVFTENCREYTLIRAGRLGTLLQMEVGAMLVGRICNHMRGPGRVTRGQEKGLFQYGGSTVILLTEAGRVRLSPEFREGTGEEVPVRLGQKIGESAGKD